MTTSSTDRQMPKVVITGMGAVTNLGHDATSTWEAMRDARSGISPIEGDAFAAHPDAQWVVKIAGQVKGLDASAVMQHREQKRVDPSTVFGVVAAEEAVRASGIDFEQEDAERCGVVVGSGIGGIMAIEESLTTLANKGPGRISPLTVPKLMVNATAGNISIRYGLKGPSGAHATACASSGHALGDALNMIRRGWADVMVVGGTESAITPLTVGAFMTMKALSSRNDAPHEASRPFDADRDGFVLAEGAGMMVLETEEHAKARGATILAELVGYGNSSDAGHITAPDAEGRGAERAMRMALEDSGLEPEQVSYINAHGTSTPLGDAAEVRACMTVFGDHAAKSKGGTLMMSSTKSVHGHCLGASGAVEMVACVNAVRLGLVPPTANLHNPQDGFDMDFVPNEARKADVKYAMNNTFGFGGHNVSLVIGRYDG